MECCEYHLCCDIHSFFVCDACLQGWYDNPWFSLVTCWYCSSFLHSVCFVQCVSVFMTVHLICMLVCLYVKHCLAGAVERSYVNALITHTHAGAHAHTHTESQLRCHFNVLEWGELFAQLDQEWSEIIWKYTRQLGERWLTYSTAWGWFLYPGIHPLGMVQFLGLEVILFVFFVVLASCFAPLLHSFLLYISYNKSENICRACLQHQLAICATCVHKIFSETLLNIMKHLQHNNNGTTN